MRQFGYLQGSYQDAHSTKHKKRIWVLCFNVQDFSLRKSNQAAISHLHERTQKLVEMCWRCVPMIITVVGLLCTVLLSCVCICYLTCTVLLCAYCSLTYFSCRIAGLQSVSGRSYDRPPRHSLFSRFPCVYKQMLRRFPTFQVATTRFSCSPPDLNLLVTNFMFCLHVK